MAKVEKTSLAKREPQDASTSAEKEFCQATCPDPEDAVTRAHKGLLQSLPVEMTTTQAAEFLDVSRPFVIKLVDQGELPCRKVGKHRRIPTSALQDYKKKMFHAAKAAASEMTKTSQELGLYDLEGPPPNAR